MSQATQESSLTNTKQLLDELDALMEKMLALPVSDDDAAEPRPWTGGMGLPSLDDASREGSRAASLSATLTVLEPPAPVETLTAGEPLEPGRQVSAEPVLRVDGPQSLGPPHAELWRRAEDESSEMDLPPDAVPPSLLVIQVPEPSALPAPRQTLTGLVVQPLIWINAIFDVATRLLGPPGRLLRTGPGRNLLGLAGIALFVLAIGWLIKDWMSWAE